MPQRMSPPDTHSPYDPFDALRRDRDRWAQTAMEQAQYIRQLEEQVQLMNERINELMNERIKTQSKTMETSEAKTIINNYGTYIAEQHNDIHDNHNCPIYACPTNDEAYSQPLPKRRGDTDQRTKKLFMSDGAEDMQHTEEERNRFLNYLAEHHLGQRQVDCYKDNPINKAIVCFCAKWKRLKYIDSKPSPAAVLRFLTETCGISCAADTEALSSLLGRMLKAEYDKDVFYDVEEYF